MILQGSILQSTRIISNASNYLCSQSGSLFRYIRSGTTYTHRLLRITFNIVISTCFRENSWTYYCGEFRASCIFRLSVMCLWVMTLSISSQVIIITINIISFASGFCKSILCKDSFNNLSMYKCRSICTVRTVYARTKGIILQKMMKNARLKRKINDTMRKYSNALSFANAFMRHTIRLY